MIDQKLNSSTNFDSKDKELNIQVSHAGAINFKWFALLDQSELNVKVKTAYLPAKGNLKCIISSCSNLCDLLSSVSYPVFE